MSEPNASGENLPAPIVVVTAEKRSYSLETTAELAEVHPDLILYYHQLGLLDSAHVTESAEVMFDDNAVYELRRIEHYRRHLGVNRQALPLVLNLLREVERLEAELRFLRGP